MNKKTFFESSSKKFFFDDLKATAAYCKLHWPEDVAHILRVADEVVEQKFLFDLKWDMERTYEYVSFNGEIDWGYKPGDDPEFIFQFNRHRFWICLGQAYALTGNEKYAKTFVNQLLSWIKQNPLNNQTRGTTWRTIEAGLRGEYWCKAIRYFEESPYLTDTAIDAFYHSLIEHAEYIVSAHSPYRLMSNWGVLENHGLFEIGITLPEGQYAHDYTRIALEHLETEIRLQIMDDGVQWEQSPMYHNEVYHCYLDVLILAMRNGVEVSETLKDCVKRMAYANVAWKKPNHHQPMQGDSDDTDIRDLISKGAYVFKDPVLKFAGLPILDFESVWDLGIQAAQEYIKLEEKQPDFVSKSLADSGNYYMRSGWDEEANWLHFHCGTLGAGHGHSDKLHFDLVLYGEDVFMDAGRYTYVAKAERYAFKDPEAHNTITVDNKKFTVCKDSWECSKLSQPVKGTLVIKDNYEFVQGGHLGYMDTPGGVFANRKIIHIKPDIYIVVDEMYTGDTHSYQQYFHFNNKGTVLLEGHKACYIGEKAEAEVYFLTPDIKVECKESQISRHYNKAEKNKMLKTHIEKEGFCSMITVISGNPLGKLEPIEVAKVSVKSTLKGINYPDHYAEALKIKKGEKTYVVVVCHQEVNSPTDLVEAEGCMGFGNVIVFEPAEAKEVGHVLYW